MNVNMESVMMMLKFAGGMLAILGIVYALACVTPRLAKIVDKMRKKKPEAPEEESFPDVKGLYDAQTEAPAEEETDSVKGIYDLHKKEASDK